MDAEPPLAFPAMQLRDFFSVDGIALQLSVTTKAEALVAMVGLLHVDTDTAETIGSLLDRREQLGSCGVGRGIAIPHCRAPLIPQLRLAYGRIPAGIPYDAIDGQPVHNLFLIVAPPVEVSNLYLPVLGRLAQFAKGIDVPEKLAALASVDDFFALLDDR
jgi:mannitol/fructose-specific phosphotransferase system IIA component (Ntr-type)